MPNSDPPVLPFDPTPEAVAGWLAGLPMENSRERCKQLFAGLRALNGSGLEPSLHVRMLERMRPMAELESGKLMAGFLGKPLPLDERVRNAAKLSAQFQLELARGFESVTRDRSLDLGEAELARRVRVALLAYEQYVLRLALMYEPVSSKLWSGVHALFRFATQAGLDERRDLGIGAVFKRLLAFRSVCANRFGQEDIRRLHELLREYGESMNLGPEPAADGVPADFAIDLESGALPGPVAAGSAPDGGRRYLFTGTLRRRLAQQMQPSAPEGKRLREDFALRLLVRLGGFPSQAPEQKGRQAMVVGGLDAVCGVAAKVERLKAGGGWAGFGDLELLPLSDHGGAASPPGQSKSAGAFADHASGRKMTPVGAGGLFSRSEGEYPCTVLRAETPGFYLLETAAALQTGRLAALNTDNKLIQAGVVGASRVQGGGRLFAFELVANDVRPVRVFSTALPAPLTGLLAQAGREDRFSLILPPSKLRNGVLLEVDSGGRRRSYCIGRLLEVTAEFAQFELILQLSGGCGS